MGEESLFNRPRVAAPWMVSRILPPSSTMEVSDANGSQCGAKRIGRGPRAQHDLLRIRRITCEEPRPLNPEWVVVVER